MIGRARPGPPPTGDSTSAQLARLRARVDQALALVGEHLHKAGSNRQLADSPLDIRNALDPPRRT